MVVITNLMKTISKNQVINRMTYFETFSLGVSEFEKTYSSRFFLDTEEFEPST
jgi:hypothetical protein